MRNCVVHYKDESDGEKYYYCEEEEEEEATEEVGQGWEEMGIVML